jgi:hypothetical protein
MPVLGGYVVSQSATAYPGRLCVVKKQLHMQILPRSGVKHNKKDVLRDISLKTYITQIKQHFLSDATKQDNGLYRSKKSRVKLTAILCCNSISIHLSCDILL